MSDVNVASVPAAQVSREVAQTEWNKLIGGNEYQPGDSKGYSATHPNALSDGDEKGKGEAQTIGSKTDIVERNKLITMNLYGSNKPYTNPDV